MLAKYRLFSMAAAFMMASGLPSQGALAFAHSDDAIEAPLIVEDGGLWVRVVINDRVTTRMLIDTGASAVIIPASLAGALDIQGEGRPVTLRTVQGRTTGRRIRLESLSIGDALVDDVTAVVLDQDDEESVGLLGRSFLSQFHFSFDFERNILELAPRTRGRPLALDASRATELLARQIEGLRQERARAMRDPNTSDRYIARIERSIEVISEQQSLFR